MRCALSISPKRLIDSAIFQFLIRTQIFEQGLWKDTTISKSCKLFFFFYVSYSVNITVYRSLTDFFVFFFFSQVPFDFQINVLQGICFPFSKIRISIVKYHYKTYTLVYYFEDNTTICVCRRIQTLFYVDQLVD